MMVSLERLIERGVDGGVAPSGPACLFTSVIACEGLSAHPSLQLFLHPVFVPRPQVSSSTHGPVSSCFHLSALTCTPCSAGCSLQTCLQPGFLTIYFSFSLHLCCSAAPMLLHPRMPRQTNLDKSNFTAKCAREKVTFHPGLFQETLGLRGQRANRQLPTLFCRQKEQKRSIIA